MTDEESLRGERLLLERLRSGKADVVDTAYARVLAARKAAEAQVADFLGRPVEVPADLELSLANAIAESVPVAHPPAAIDSPDDSVITGRKFGTCGDMMTEDVLQIIEQAVRWYALGGKLPAFYERQHIADNDPRSYTLETLQGWLKRPTFVRLLYKQSKDPLVRQWLEEKRARYLT